VGLCERIIADRVEEERRKGRPLGMFHNSDSPALDRRLADAPGERLGYGADLALLHRYVHTGPTNAGTGMRYRALRQKYQKEYTDFKTETRGQGVLL
jgi:hypothetical protein